MQTAKQCIQVIHGNDKVSLTPSIVIVTLPFLSTG